MPISADASGSRKQRGFVGAGLMDLAFLLILILIGIGLWTWLSTIVTGDLALAAALIWLMAAGAAYGYSREQTLVLRLPLGFLLFLGIAVVLAPLSCWSGSKIAVAVAGSLAALAARYPGTYWSARLKQNKTARGAPPFYLDQSINLLDDLFRWLGVSIVAWFAVGVLPLLLVFVFPVEWIPGVAMVWGFAATAYYLYAVRKSHVRFLKLPLGLWALAATTLVLKVFQDRIAGPLEAGSVWLIGYSVYYPVIMALFVEIVLLGTPRSTPPPADRPAQP